MKVANILFVVVITIAIFFAATVQAEKLNVSTKGLDRVETRLIKTALANYGLPLSTPLIIKKKVVEGNWNGRKKEFNSVEVRIQTAYGEFVSEVDNRSYPQLPGEEYYGILELALHHACAGPERIRHEAKLDAAFAEIKKMVGEKARVNGYTVIFHERNLGTTEIFFKINDVLCRVGWIEGDTSPVYSMVRNRTMEPVKNLDAIFTSIPKK
ncbi:MAG: hypothetical protein PHZ04_04370 [Patescibacteria group bacterium]|nr:hypothetical protein [Patescibacteria group bacterium]MDD5294653.1 hypothetical protein [Patescibacteria group bacterium]MDD5554497.1 hypothetical protein [Patescibacteria group bacterium]